MEFIKKLPYELIITIYGFIPINIRLQLLTEKYPLSMLHSYNYLLTVESTCNSQERRSYY